MNWPLAHVFICTQVGMVELRASQYQANMYMAIAPTWVCENRREIANTPKLMPS